MKHLWPIFLALIAFQTKAQDDNFYQLSGYDNFYPRNFPKVQGVKMVIVKADCKKCVPVLDQEHSETYVFNSKGFNIEQYNVFKGRKSGMQKFFWNPDGTVSRYQGYNTYRSTIDISVDSATYENDYGQAWDSTLLTKEVRYSYNADKKLKTITWLDGDDLSVDIVINFYYDRKGRVLKEELTDFPDKGDIILGFKPNSTTAIEERPDTKKQIRNFKLFKYAGDTVFVEYYKTGKLSGKGKQTFNKSGKLTYVATYNLNGELLFQIKNVFNKKGNLIDQTIFQTGYDGYGDGNDYAAGDRRTFEYNKQGRLVTMVEYYKDEVFMTSTFEYK